VLDVDAAPASEILAGFLAEYGSGSEDADVIDHHVIDVDQEASQAADSRMKELRKKWTAHVKKTQQGKDREEVQLPDPLIEKLETMIKSKSKRAKNVRTSWSLEDKRTVWRRSLKLSIHRTARRRREKRRRRRRRISEEEEEAQPTCRILWILILTIHRTARRRRGKRRRRRSSSSSLPSTTRHGKNPGDRR
jgi:hypothetical protein